MEQEELIWEVLQKSCKSRIKTKVGVHCRDTYNVTGLCHRLSCPLANSRYATVKEFNAKVYLYIKVVERLHTPKKMWRKIKLNDDYNIALKQIDKYLKYWSSPFIFKVKQKLTRIKQYLLRVRELSKQTSLKVIPINKKIEKLRIKRAARAEIVARIDNAIENELIKRLQEGTYGEIYNIPIKEYNNNLEREIISVEETNNENELEYESEIEFVEDDEIEELIESEDDIEDIGENLMKSHVIRPRKRQKPLIKLTNEENNDDALELELEEEYETIH